MKSDYKNWVPKGMIAGLGAASAVLAAEGVSNTKSMACFCCVKGDGYDFLD